jgi:hypothetical protein
MGVYRAIKANLIMEQVMGKKDGVSLKTSNGPANGRSLPAETITPAIKNVQCVHILIGGAGFRPQRAATNFSSDPATPPAV